MAEMRLMPPTITEATIRAIITPMMKRRVAVFSMPAGVVKTVVIDSTSWFACITQRVPIRPTTAKKVAKGRHASPSPLISVYMVPPCGWPSES